jgi:hypothetical protein
MQLDNMILKYRSLGLTNEEFDRDIKNAVNWENIVSGPYIACHRFPLDHSQLWSHDAIVQEVNPDKIVYLNPGRNEDVTAYPISCGGYGKNWFLINPEDYTGPIDDK